MARSLCFALLALVLGCSAARAEDMTAEEVRRHWDNWVAEETRTFEGWRALSESDLGLRLDAYVKATDTPEGANTDHWKARLLLAVCMQFRCGGVRRNEARLKDLVCAPPLNDLSLQPAKDYIQYGVLRYGRVLRDFWDDISPDTWGDVPLRPWADPQDHAWLDLHVVFKDDKYTVPGFPPTLIMYAANYVGYDDNDIYYSHRLQLLSALPTDSFACLSLEAWFHARARKHCDVAQAERLLHHADEKGYRLAQYALGRLYDPFDGPAPNLDKARYHYRAALAGGVREARWKLARLPSVTPPAVDIETVWKKYCDGWACVDVVDTGRAERLPRGKPNLVFDEYPELFFQLGPFLEATSEEQFNRKVRTTRMRCVYAECLMYGVGGARKDDEQARWWLARAEGPIETGILEFDLACRSHAFRSEDVLTLARSTELEKHAEAMRRISLFVIGECNTVPQVDLTDYMSWQEARELNLRYARAGYELHRWAMARHFERTGETESRLYWLDQLSKGGDAEAMLQLAWLYMDGFHLKRDLAEARRLIEAAARVPTAAEAAAKALLALEGMELEPAAAAEVESLAAHMNAHASLDGWAGFCPGATAKWKRASNTSPGALLYAACLLQGHECAPDLPAARKLLDTAGDQVLASYFIGQLQEHTESGYRTAIFCYRAAAGFGSACAALRLGELALAGHGQARDPEAAQKWFTQAAEGGCIPAMRALGAMLETGDGVTADRAQALVWYRKAAEKGDEAAKDKVAELEK